MARVSKKRNAYVQPEQSAKVSGRSLYQTAIYARLSVEDNGKDSDSLEAQVQYLKSFLEDKPQMELCGIFTDNGFTGISENDGSGEGRKDSLYYCKGFVPPGKKLH